MDLATTDSATGLVTATEAFAPAHVGALAEAVPRALRGSTDGCAVFVHTVGLLIAEVLAALDPEGAATPAGLRTLELRALTTPLGGWAATFGPGPGTAAAVVALVREAVGPPPPPPPVGHVVVDVEDLYEFSRRSGAALRGTDEPLAVIRRELQLTLAELGGLFGVTRQAVTAWVGQGVPPSRRRDVAEVHRAVTLLVRATGPGLPAVIARRPLQRYGGATLLDAFAADPRALAVEIQRDFDWSGGV